jgi:alkylation response protein AidB-like acyl-CoA dehydrogenase
MITFEVRRRNNANGGMRFAFPPYGLEGVQIMGGYGYLTKNSMERHFRDAKAGQIYEGSNEIMRLIVARELLK